MLTDVPDKPLKQGAQAADLARLAVFCLAMLFAVPVTLAAPADEVRVLLEQGRSAEAYALGKSSPEELGKPEFDFYFGIAAVDSAHAGEGVLALERYIVNFPDNNFARLELARGYYVLGELLRAREEFEAVSKTSPGPSVQATIDRFLDSIQAQETKYSGTASFYVEVGSGFDSNVNSGVDSQSINLPSFGRVELAESGVRSSDHFVHLGAGAQFSRPVAPGITLIGGLGFEDKRHDNTFDRHFDQSSLSVYGGVSAIKNRDVIRGTVSYSTIAVDSTGFRDTTGLGGEWHRQLDELNTGSLFVQYAELSYPHSPVRDADYYAIGAGWRRAFVGKLQPVLQIQTLVGQESNKAAPVRNDLSRDLYTLRAGLSLTPAPKWGLSAGATYTNSQFIATDPLFRVRREDDYYGVELGASYRWSKPVTLRADYLRSDNRSNTALYKYDRDVVTFKLRYEFR